MVFKKSAAILVLGLFLFGIDRGLKWLALHGADYPYLFWGNWLGWEKFLNPGIAFGVPVPLAVAFFLSVPIILIVGYYFILALRQEEFKKALGFFLIMVGAVSNLIDRGLYGYTVDYVRIFTGVFNVADGCILGGAGLVLWIGRQNKKPRLPNFSS